MLAACIIVVACTLFCSNNHSFFFYRESCKLHFSQSVLTPLETGKDAREVKKKSAQCVRTERVHLHVLF